MGTNVFFLFFFLFVYFVHQDISSGYCDYNGLREEEKIGGELVSELVSRQRKGIGLHRPLDAKNQVVISMPVQLLQRLFCVRPVVKANVGKALGHLRVLVFRQVDAVHRAKHPEEVLNVHLLGVLRQVRHLESRQVIYEGKKRLGRAALTNKRGWQYPCHGTWILPSSRLRRACWGAHILKDHPGLNWQLPRGSQPSWSHRD